MVHGNDLPGYHVSSSCGNISSVGCFLCARTKCVQTQISKYQTLLGFLENSSNLRVVALLPEVLSNIRWKLSEERWTLFTIGINCRLLGLLFLSWLFFVRLQEECSGAGKK